MPRTVIFILPLFPHPVATFLVVHGYAALEAHSAEQAVPMLDLHEVDAIIVAPGEPSLGTADLRSRRITLNLTIHAAWPDVLFELSNILPSTQYRTQ